MRIEGIAGARLAPAVSAGDQPSLALRLLAGGGGPPRARCPRCEAASLVEVVRRDVAIDRCRRCGGVWLDPGELERLVADRP